MEKTGAQIVCETLLNLGVSHLFGYNGGAILPFYHALSEYPNLKHIMVRHEQAAAFAAQGWARATGKLGVCIATSGPGAMNLVTGVADAFMDSIPLMAITGQVATKYIGTDAFQESDVIGVMLPITKSNKMLDQIDSLSIDIKNMASIALSGRMGPVHIDIPKDIQNTKIKVDTKKVKSNFLKKAIPINNLEINQAIKLISNSLKPIVLIGHGVISAHAKLEMEGFIKKFNIPFSPTLHGLTAVADIYPISHKLNLGMMGMHGTVAANLAIKNADLIISFGMRFDDRVTGKLETYAKDATVIHVDIDDSELDKNVLTNLAIHGDLKEVLNAINEKSIKTESNHNNWLYEIYEYEKEWEVIEKDFLKVGVGPNKKLLMSYVINKLSEITHGSDNIVSDVGQHQMFAARYYAFNKYNSWFCSGGAGTMGFALPTAMCVQLARPNETVWCICGDGGFQMNIQELITIKNNNLPIKIIILNNEFLGMVKQWQSLFHKDNFSATPLINPDFQLIAKANGIESNKVTNKDKLDEAIIVAKNHEGPY